MFEVRTRGHGSPIGEETSMKIARLFFLSACFFVCAEAYCQQARNTVDWTDYALVLAAPSSVTESKKKEIGDEIFIGSAFEVNLEKIDVIYGEMDDRTIRVVLLASHKESISRKREIYVLLKTDEGYPKAISWGVPESVACFDKKKLDSRIANDFFLHDYRNERVCTNLRWFK
jgi:hypothetical protein